MRRDEILSLVIDMIAFHKEFQDIDGADIITLAAAKFKTPETGYLLIEGTYKIDKSGVYVDTTSKKFRFPWNDIIPHISTIRKQNLLF